MLIWIAFALLTAAVVAALTLPLFRGSSRARDAREADMAMYRDQLEGIERERGDGLLDPAEASSARAEVARRLLDASRRSDETSGGLPPPVRKRIAYAVSALIPLAGAGLYLALGSPNLPGQPHASRVGQPLEKAPIEEIVAKVEARLQEAPNDGAGWDAVAPVYLLQQRYADAARAYARAVDLLGETPARLTGFAEATIRAGDGVVNDAARVAYERLLKLDPKRRDATFWLSLAREQDGDLKAAAAGFREVAADEAADSRWREAARQRLAAIEKEAGPQAPVASGNGKEIN